MNTQLKNKIMRRIYVIFIIQKLTQSVTLEWIILLGSFGIMAFFVSVGQVLTNALHNMDNSYGFWTGAFLQTEPMVKVLVISAAGAGILIIKTVVQQTYTGTTKLANRLFARA